MKWISVDTELPPDGMNVIARYTNSCGNRRTIMGSYVRKFTIESGPDDESCFEWDEEEEISYVTEGWYESIDNWGDFSSIRVHEGEIEKWMPVPD